MKMPKATTVLFAAFLMGGCAGGDDDPLVARAGDHRLTVDDATRLLASVDGLPNDPGVVQALADLWVDYTLLAQALATDSTLEQLDLEPLLREQIDQRMVLALRDSVIEVDTVVTDADIEARYAEGPPGERVEARHILMTWPQGASPEVKDSVRTVMEGLLEEIRGGADFAQLAREYSQDGSASEGGYLGWFERGDMIRALDDAAFQLQPGQVSGVVESAFGYHIVFVEDRETPSLEEVAPNFRELIRAERFQHAESLYIAGVEADADMQLVEGAPELVRELARDPDQTLSSRARGRTLMTYDGGELTLGEAQRYMAGLQPQPLQQLSQAPDEAIDENFLRGRAQRELLVQMAEEAGLTPGPEVRDSLSTLVRDRFREIGRALRVHPLEPTGSESRAQAIDRIIEEELRAIITGTKQVIPLDAVSVILRDQADARVLPAGIQATVDAIAVARGPQVTAPPTAPPTAPAPADSGGG